MKEEDKKKKEVATTSLGTIHLNEDVPSLCYSIIAAELSEETALNA